MSKMKRRQGANIKWNAAKVIAGLQAFYAPYLRRGERCKPPPPLETTNPPLIGGARRVFGSLKAAMQAAGLPYPPQKPTPWNRKTILQALLQMHLQGKDLSLAAVSDRSNGSLLGPATRCFGSWRKAIEAAGINYSDVARVREWHADDVVKELQMRHRQGLPINSGAMQKQAIKLWGAAKRCFGSYAGALAAAGYPLDPDPPEWSFTPQQFTNAIKKLHRQGVDLASARIRNSHPHLFFSARRKIGSWEKAVESAGISYASVRRARNWTKQDIIQRLQELHKAGANLWAGAIQKDHIALSGAVQRYFGSLRNAMKAAGLAYPDYRARTLAHWTEEMVLKTLIELHAEGYDLRYRNIQAKRQPLFYAARHYFGSYIEAVAQAGIDYWEMSQGHFKRSPRAIAATQE